MKFARLLGGNSGSWSLARLESEELHNCEDAFTSADMFASWVQNHQHHSPTTDPSLRSLNPREKKKTLRKTYETFFPSIFSPYPDPVGKQEKNRGKTGKQRGVGQWGSNGMEGGSLSAQADGTSVIDSSTGREGLSAAIRHPSGCEPSSHWSGPATPMGGALPVSKSDHGGSNDPAGTQRGGPS
ncbi:hypothetical protein KM043_009163 [Ampulex compressa]|nr:hypothetical protein KM043_009163 [Ampulex compressa]